MKAKIRINASELYVEKDVHQTLNIFASFEKLEYQAAVFSFLERCWIKHDFERDSEKMTITKTSQQPEQIKLEQT